MEPKEEFMWKAIEIAKESAKKGDYALGAVIVKGDEIISTGTTNLKHENDPTVHAEIVAIRNACRDMGVKYLEGCILYSTHEPCPMCISSAIWAKMQGIVYGATIEDAKSHQSDNFSWRQIDIPCREVISKGSPKLKLVEGLLREECNKLFELAQ
jgi:tRNA(Arg) A34 adenosine deaminase TadA